jgi:hypothetical protein
MKGKTYLNKALTALGVGDEVYSKNFRIMRLLEVLILPFVWSVWHDVHEDEQTCL